MTDDDLAASADRVLARVRSGSWRADVERAAARQRQRWVTSATAALVIVAIGGLFALAARWGDRAVSNPGPTVVAPQATLTAGEPCPAPTRSPAVVVPAHSCGWLAAAVNSSINAHCLSDRDAEVAVDGLLDTEAIRDTWSVTVESGDDGCATVWVDAARRQLVVATAVACLPVEPPVEATLSPSTEDIEHPSERNHCAEVGEALRAVVNGRCLTAAEAEDAARAALVEVQAHGWVLETNPTELCALAWLDQTTMTVTIADNPP